MGFSLSQARSRIAACVIVGALLAPASAGASLPLTGTGTTSKLISLVPGKGIGVVRLNEKRSAVTNALGKGRTIRRGSNAGLVQYRSATIDIEVSYGGGLVDGVNTSSRGALIYGRPLSEGLKRLRPVFRSHHWSVVSCRGESYTMLGQGGPGTGIAWRHGRLDYVQIDPGGSIGDWCLPLPSDETPGGALVP
jgi:hypothetical protein